MSIPIHLQQFKAAGIYRVVFDKSTIVNYDTELLRLVVGYSEKGPFNTPVYVKDPQTFVALFGGINKKLEKRGIYFHRLALQMLQVSPILCLNLKKFNGETVDGVTIDSSFNPSATEIDTVKLNVEDIYDTTRFWTLDAEKLNDLRSTTGTVMDQYINICTTNTKKTSSTIFIRKASGLKVSQYNLTVNDWYSDKSEPMPDFLIPYKNNLVSDFFGEIYVFSGMFTAKQVLASDSLKNYFVVETSGEGEDKVYTLKLRDKVHNAFGDAVDTLDALYADPTSNALGHYVGALIPEFKNKNNVYSSLDVAFNNDIDVHNLMMSFNTELLYEEGTANIDLSGRMSIPTKEAENKVGSKTLSLDKLFAGTATTTVLGNIQAPVITDKLTFTTNVTKLNEEGKYVTKAPLTVNKKSISGILYVANVTSNEITLKAVIEKTIDAETGEYTYIEPEIKVQYNEDQLSEKSIKEIAKTKFGVVFASEDPTDYTLVNGRGTSWSNDTPAFANGTIHGPEKVITAISNILQTADDESRYTDKESDIKAAFMNVQIIPLSEYNIEDNVYGSSVSFIGINTGGEFDKWQYVTDFELVTGVPQAAFICENYSDRSMISILQKGDCILGKDGVVDYDEDGEIDEANNFYDTVYVQETGTKYEDGQFVAHYVLLSAEPNLYEDENMNQYLVRIDNPLNQEVGTVKPIYLEGYTYMSGRPDGTGMYAKLEWQKNILSVLSEYKGLRTGLLNKAEIDYRYVIDTFESFPDTSIKKELGFLCKQKQSAFCIANFPSVKTFIKCPYISFTDNNGIFNVEYVVKGLNNKKAAATVFSLPDDSEGASFMAFYTPLKFSDGYVDNLVPSAGLVSNLFIEKYMSRQPYYIVAGPNYGAITASGLVGPDYRYSQDELQLIEPFGVNCMVYRPNFGTFINANQTAKQTPLSALSKVNVRELVIYLQDEVEKVLQAYQWEFNNNRTRQAILSRADDICARIASNGGIQAFLNIMDESNNTPEIIDNEMAVLSTHIEPGMGCGKMVHELTIYKTGQMMSSINEG